MENKIRLIMLVAGMGCICAGCALYSLPLGLVVLGGLLIYAAWRRPNKMRLKLMVNKRYLQMQVPF